MTEERCANTATIGVRTYNDSEVVKIVNQRQFALYVKNGVKPIDIKWGYDKVVYVFLVKDTEELFKRWVNYTLD